MIKCSKIALVACCLSALTLVGSANAGKASMQRQVNCGSAFEKCMSRAFKNNKDLGRAGPIIKCAVVSYQCRCSSETYKDKACKYAFPKMFKK